MKKILACLIILVATSVNAQCPSVTLAPTATITSCTSGITVTATSNYNSNISSSWTGPGGIPMYSSGTGTSVIDVNYPGNYIVTFKDLSSSCVTTQTIAVSTAVGKPAFQVTSAQNFSVSCVAPAVINIANAVASPTNPGGPVSYTAGAGSMGTLPGGNLGFASTFSTTTCGGYYVATRDNINGCTSSFNLAVTCNTQAPVLQGTATPSIICAGGTSTLTASGAQSYTFSFGGPVVSPTMSTCYAIVGTNSAGCQNTICVPVIVSIGPTVTVNSASTCAGTGNVTLTAGGANNYTWLPGSMTGANIIMSPTVSTCYTVIGSNGTGCNGSAVSCVSVYPMPVVSVNGPTAICNGQTANLSANGANSYYWNTASSSQNINVNPASNTCYTVYGMSANGCISPAVHCLTVNAPPVLSASGSTTLCSLQPVTFTASGASTYLWSSNTQTFTVAGSTFSFVPTVNSTIQVVGTAVNGCTNMITSSYTVVSTPSGTVTASSGTVCLGSSSTLSVSGSANNYSWSAGGSSNTLVVTPTVTMTYSVVLSNSNGCTSTRTVNVVVNSNCADVWPGDANSDGTVNTLDVFELGLQSNSTGPVRVPGGNTYVAQYANVWTGTISTGKNKCHADCNGDGIVGQADTTAIFNNFSLNHSFRPSAASGDISLVSSSGRFEAGRWNTIDVMAGDAGNTLYQLYGLSMDINFDQSVVEPDSIYVTYNNSFLNYGGSNIQFRKTIFSNGRVVLASVRTDQTPVSGFGKVAEIHFKAKQQVIPGTQLNLSAGNVQRTNSAGNISTLSGGSTILALETNPAGLSSSDVPDGICVFPVPASDIITITQSKKIHTLVTITDLSGRTVFSGEMQDHLQVDVNLFGAGVYLLTLSHAEGSAHRRMIVAE